MLVKSTLREQTLDCSRASGDTKQHVKQWLGNSQESCDSSYESDVWSKVSELMSVDVMDIKYIMNACDYSK